MLADLKEHLKGLPEYCRLIPVNGKVPTESDWRHNTYTLDEVCTKSKSGVGIVLGVLGNDVAAIDCDGIGHEENFEHHFGRSISDLPQTIAFTSGTPHRHQLLLKVPEEFWLDIKHKILQKDNCAPVELRWTGQSVVAGKHPSGRNYEWVEGCSPSEVGIAEAPGWFLSKWAELSAPKSAPKLNKGNPRSLTKGNPHSLPTTQNLRSSPAKGILSDRAKAATGNSTENYSEQALKIHNLTRAKKGLKEWFVDEKYYVEHKWRDIGIALKQLGNDDWGDPDKFFDLWDEWSERDPRPGKYEGRTACAEKWESMEIRHNGITFNSFIQWAIDDGFLTYDDLPDSEKVNVNPKSEPKVDPEKAIAEIVDELYELEKSNGNWNRNQYLRSQLGGYRIRKEIVDDRLFQLFAKEHDLPLGNYGGERKHRTLGSQLTPNEELRPQLKGFTLAGRDHVIYGQAGAGKTTFALALSYAVFSGHNNLFDKEDGVAMENQGATLWLGSDGEDGALGMAQAYIRKLKPPKQAEWENHTTFVGANKETGEPPWGFTISNLHWLMNELESGHPSGVPYRLLAMDSLKKILELAGIDFGIGPVGTCMRLMQAIAARFNVSLVWIHHPKPGASVTNMGIDAAGGNGNINQIPYGIIQLTKKEHKKSGQFAQVEIQKLRGEQSRKFNITLDEKNGLYSLVTPEEAEDKTALILYELWIRKDAGASTQEIADGIQDGSGKKTIANQLTPMHKQKLVQSTKRRWYLTKSGYKRLAVDFPSISGEVQEFLEGEGKSIR